MTERLSNRQALDLPYQAIIDQAKPGDVIFFISEKSSPEQNRLKLLYRSWLGFDFNDNTNWHTAVYTGAKKDGKGSRFRPYLIHAVPTGVNHITIPPEYFKHKEGEDGTYQKSRLEIVQSPDLENSDRDHLVQYCLSQQGRAFDNDERWFRNISTYLLGIKSLKKEPNKVSCHGMVFEAYNSIGFHFPHQLNSAPNLIGRLLGHPLGHPADEVDLKHNYLRDHHLYRDRRFNDVLAIDGGPDIRDVKITYNPEKYSWDPMLQLAYGFLAIDEIIAEHYF